MDTPTQSITGLIERITFHNEENGFCILKVKAKGHKNLITVVGSLATANAGEWIEATGTWIHDHHYGQQFKALQLLLTPPTTLEGIEKYLASGLIKGIGPVYAKKIVQTFGEDVFEIIENNPKVLGTVPGLGPYRCNRIVSGWADQQSIRSIMLFLHNHNISTAQAARIYKVYGNEAVRLIQENPYRLAQDIRGIGFLSADKVAEKLGIDKSSLIRAQAGLLYTLIKAKEEGHCGLPVEELISDCQLSLGIDKELLIQALELERQKGSVVQDAIDGHLCVFSSTLYFAEKGIAARLQQLNTPELPWPTIDIPEAIKWVEERNKISLSETQKQALTTTLSHKITIITGGPGVGKTTLLNSILQILKAKQMQLALCAPTGRAAKRMTETTRLPAKTIHRLLNINPITGIFSYNEYCPFPCDVMVIDEISMVDVPLMHGLLKAIPDHAAIILVGDQDQLPSVGPGQVLADLIASQTIPFIHLTETFRQAASSIIISVANSINKGIMPDLQGYGSASDFFFIENHHPEQALRTIVDLVTKRLPLKLGYSPLQDIQVLSPMSRGLCGTRTLNTELQKALNPVTTSSIQKFGCWYSVGDKVMQTENNYTKEVYNGDIGFIEMIDCEENQVVINFDNRKIAYDLHELDEIALAYALTIHKSQGSEYPVVIIPILTQHQAMLQKNLIYTGITRGKKLVILVGQKQALAMAIDNQNSVRRWSMLGNHQKKRI